jgi:hypothetical protein
MSPPIPVDEGSVIFNAAAIVETSQTCLSSLIAISTYPLLQQRPQHFLLPSRFYDPQRLPEAEYMLRCLWYCGQYSVYWQTGQSPGSVWNKQCGS